MRHGPSSSSDYVNGSYSSGSSNRYDQRSDYGEYLVGDGDAAPSRDRRGGGYGGFDDATTPTESDFQQSHSRAHVPEYANGGWVEEIEQGDWQGAEQSRNMNGGTRRAVDGQGSRQIEG